MGKKKSKKTKGGKNSEAANSKQKENAPKHHETNASELQEKNCERSSGKPQSKDMVDHSKVKETKQQTCAKDNVTAVKEELNTKIDVIQGGISELQVINDLKNTNTDTVERKNSWDSDAIFNSTIEENSELNDMSSHRVKPYQSSFSNRKGSGSFSEPKSNKLKSSHQNKNKESLENSYDFWEKNYRSITEFTKVQEIEGNLFQQSKEYSLAHCVAEDLRMGSGIAVDFKQQFKNLPVLLDQRAKQGGLAVLHIEEDNRYIYYLVTKRESIGKPTYETLHKSLSKMKVHVEENQVTKLAIPRLGCGLDRLDWDKVKSMLEFLFKDVNIEIRVCNFQQDIDTPKRHITCKLVQESYHVTKIERGTMIFYFSTSNGDKDTTMQELANKFNYLPDFDSRRYKRMGDIILYDKDKDYGLCGCVVRNTTKDPFDFKAFSTCLREFHRANQKYRYDAFSYVTFQKLEEEDYKDDLINQKVLTLMINQLKNVDVYYCTGSFK